MRCPSRVLTCIAPQCQESPFRVIYQSHSLIAKNSLFGGRCAPHRLFSAGNTVSIHETSPYRARPANGRGPLPPTRGALPYPNFAQRGENVESQVSTFWSNVITRWVQKVETNNPNSITYSSLLREPKLHVSIHCFHIVSPHYQHSIIK